MNNDKSEIVIFRQRLHFLHMDHLGMTIKEFASVIRTLNSECTSKELSGTFCKSKQAQIVKLTVKTMSCF